MRRWRDSWFEYSSFFKDMTKRAKDARRDDYPVSCNVPSLGFVILPYPAYRIVSHQASKYQVTAFQKRFVPLGPTCLFHGLLTALVVLSRHENGHGMRIGDGSPRIW
jgi:hypothetical protein